MIYELQYCAIEAQSISSRDWTQIDSSLQGVLLGFIVARA